MSDKGPIEGRGTPGDFELSRLKSAPPQHKSLSFLGSRDVVSVKSAQSPKISYVSQDSISSSTKPATRVSKHSYKDHAFFQVLLKAKATVKCFFSSNPYLKGLRRELIEYNKNPAQGLDGLSERLSKEFKQMGKDEYLFNFLRTNYDVMEGYLGQKGAAELLSKVLVKLGKTPDQALRFMANVIVFDRGQDLFHTIVKKVGSKAVEPSAEELAKAEKERDAAPAKGMRMEVEIEEVPKEKDLKREIAKFFTSLKSSPFLDVLLEQARRDIQENDPSMSGDTLHDASEVRVTQALLEATCLTAQERVDNLGKSLQKSGTYVVGVGEDLVTLDRNLEAVKLDPKALGTMHFTLWPQLDKDQVKAEFGRFVAQFEMDPLMKIARDEVKKQSGLSAEARQNNTLDLFLKAFLAAMSGTLELEQLPESFQAHFRDNPMPDLFAGPGYSADERRRLNTFLKSMLGNREIRAEFREIVYEKIQPKRA